MSVAEAHAREGEELGVPIVSSEYPFRVDHHAVHWYALQFQRNASLDLIATPWGGC